MEQETTIQPRLADAPVPDVRGLERLVGHWTGRGTLTIDGAVSEVAVEWRCAPAALGRAVLGTMRFLGIPGLPVCEQVDVLGWNRDDDHLHWVSVCSGGEAHDRAGEWRGTQLVFADARERLRLTLSDRETLTIHWELQGGSLFDISLRRGEEAVHA
jgi:hypothetical protein